MQGLMSGQYQFASTALDNTIAIVEGQGDVKFDTDAVTIFGVHSGMNKKCGAAEMELCRHQGKDHC